MFINRKWIKLFPSKLLCKRERENERETERRIDKERKRNGREIKGEKKRERNEEVRQREIEGNNNGSQKREKDRPKRRYTFRRKLFFQNNYKPNILFSAYLFVVTFCNCYQIRLIPNPLPLIFEIKIT